MASLGPFGYSGGLNTKAGLLTIGRDQMSAAQNVQVIYGQLKKLAGSAKINTSALNSSASIIGLVDWQAVNQNRYLVIIAGSKIYQTQNLGVTPSDITGSATITAGNNNQHTFSSLNNILAICGGSDTPLQWGGSGNVASLSGSPPTGNLVTTANNFMFISGNTTTPSRVWWSNVADPGTWGAANYVDFRVSDGDIVTAIAPLNYNLVIFKRRSTGILYTQTTAVSGSTTLAPLTQVNVQTGCAGSQAWSTLPDGRLVVFGADAHLRIFDGTNFTDISDQPSPASNIQTTLDSLNISRLQYACVRIYPTLNQIWLATSTGSNTTNDSIFIYDYLYGTWQCQVPDRAANILTNSIDTRTSASHPILVLSGDYGGFVYEHDTGTTNAQNTDSHIDGYATCVVQLGAESTDFIPQSLRVACEAQTSGQLQVGWGFNALTDIRQEININESAGTSTLDVNFYMDSSTLASSPTIFTSIATPSTGRTFTMTVQVRNQYASQPFTVHPFFISDEVIT